MVDTVDGCEILHQLLDGLCHYNLLKFLQCCRVTTSYQLVIRISQPSTVCLALVHRLFT